jgi:hypothetical protein
MPSRSPSSSALRITDKVADDQRIVPADGVCPAFAVAPKGHAGSKADEGCGGKLCEALTKLCSGSALARGFSLAKRDARSAIWSGPIRSSVPLEGKEWPEPSDAPRTVEGRRPSHSVHNPSTVRSAGNNTLSL